MRAEESNTHLQWSPEEMRVLGYRVVDLLVDHFEELPEKPVARIGSREELEERLWEPIPEHGTAPEEVLETLRRDVFSRMAYVNHPRFFAFIPGPSNFAGAMADALASGFNVFAGTWLASSGPSTVELLTVDWLRELCGLPETAGGLFTSGGSMANLIALATARHVYLQDRTEDAVLYTSDQSHSAIARAANLLGFAPRQLRTLPTDSAYRLDLSALRRAVDEDRRAGQRPFCVVANAGTTNTGAVDPLEALGAFCHEEDLWLHVDGAYGAAAVITERGRARLKGLEGAHSLALDPHKWFFQPFEIGGVLVRERRWLKETFHTQPEYLEDTQRPEEEEINFGEHGPQLSRSFRALKLWFSLKVFGLASFREAVEHGLQLAETAEAILQEMPGWEVVTPAQLGIVTFRYAPEGLSPSELNALNRRLLKRMQEDGFALLSSTTLEDRLVARLCTINPRTSEADLRATLKRLDQMARRE